jgi:hypothetical protein
MWRWLLIMVVGALVINVGSVASSPVNGQRRRAADFGGKKERLVAGSKVVWREAFRGNQRACVMVEGDHKPIENLKIVVTDLQGKVVARDDGPGDFVVAIWYPPRTAEYLITITGDAKKDYNELDVVMK